MLVRATKLTGAGIPPRMPKRVYLFKSKIAIRLREEKEHMKKVNILGTEYTINKYNYTDKPDFKKRGIDGYCDSTTKEIAICNLSTYPGFEDETEEYCHLVEKEVMRHEIIHAFLNESGLQESTGTPSAGWSKNEEMVDWIAIQFPKINKVYTELGII